MVEHWIMSLIVKFQDLKGMLACFIKCSRRFETTFNCKLDVWNSLFPPTLLQVNDSLFDQKPTEIPVPAVSASIDTSASINGSSRFGYGDSGSGSHIAPPTTGGDFFSDFTTGPGTKRTSGSSKKPEVRHMTLSFLEGNRVAHLMRD